MILVSASLFTLWAWLGVDNPGDRVPSNGLAVQDHMDEGECQEKVEIAGKFWVTGPGAWVFECRPEDI